MLVDLGPANQAALQAMDESFPEWPALFFDFVLPSRSKDLFSNLWIADPHGTTPTLDGLGNSQKVPQNDLQLDVAKISNVASRRFELIDQGDAQKSRGETVGQGEGRGQPDTVPLRLGPGQRQTVKTLCRPRPARDLRA